MNLQDSFNQVYKNKLWTNNNQYTLSGPGSEIRYAQKCIDFLIYFIKKQNIKKIVDGSCGDCLWIMEVLKNFPDIEYIGYDISSEIININKKKYNKYHFFQKNLLDFEQIPDCDLFIIRHTMMHLSIENNIKIINNLKYNSKCFVFLTHHEVNKNEEGMPHGKNYSSLKWVPKNMHLKPFEIQQYLIEKFKENTTNTNEYGCIYRFTIT